MIIHNPTKVIRIPKTGVFENRSLMQDETVRLINTVHNSDDIVMFAIILCLFTGLRRSEVLRLKWSNIDFKNQTITVEHQLVREYKLNSTDEIKTRFEPKNPKTKNAKRSIHMIEPLALEFEEYKEKLLLWKKDKGFVHSEDDFVFPSKKNTGLGSKTFYVHYQKKLKEAGITDINFHTLRHTFAKRCLESGMDIFTISKTLGHAIVKITGDVYLHMTHPHQKECLDKLCSSYV